MTCATLFISPYFLDQTAGRFERRRRYFTEKCTLIIMQFPCCFILVFNVYLSLLLLPRGMQETVKNKFKKNKERKGKCYPITCNIDRARKITYICFFLNRIHKCYLPRLTHIYYFFVSFRFIVFVVYQYNLV